MVAKTRLNDVARQVGVSASTVSRVLNGVSGVSETTRRKVLEAVRQFDFRPAVSQDAPAPSRLIGLLMPAEAESWGVRTNFTEQGLRAINDTAALCNYAAMLGPFLQSDKAGWPATLRFTQWKDFNPRFGFAYRPFNNNKTVIRGGFGRYTMTILGDVFYSLTGISSSDVRSFTNNVVNGAPLFQLPQINTSGNGVTSSAYG